MPPLEQSNTEPDKPLTQPPEGKKSPEAPRPLRQVMPAEAWASALRWWARTYPGQPVNMGALLIRSGMSRSTAYEYQREYRERGFLDENNVPLPSVEE